MPPDLDIRNSNFGRFLDINLQSELRLYQTNCHWKSVSVFQISKIQLEPTFIVEKPFRPSLKDIPNGILFQHYI